MHHELSVSRLDQCGPRVPSSVLPIFRHKMRNFEIARPTLLVSYPENRLTLGVCLCRQEKKRPFKPEWESVRCPGRATLSATCRCSKLPCRVPAIRGESVCRVHSGGQRRYSKRRELGKFAGNWCSAVPWLISEAAPTASDGGLIIQSGLDLLSRNAGTVRVTIGSSDPLCDDRSGASLIVGSVIARCDEAYGHQELYH
jgi:hypothetical protein